MIATTKAPISPNTIKSIGLLLSRLSSSTMTIFISGCPNEDTRIGNIYNPKHYIDEHLLESLHKAILTVRVKSASSWY